MIHLLSALIPFTLTDITTLVPILLLVCTLFYWSSREIKESIEKSHRAQKILSHDNYEMQQKLHIQEQELKEVRRDRLNDLAKAAEFGRLSQGLFHDLIAPLTSVILHTQKLKDTDASPQHIEKALEASKRMAAYIKDIRATLQKEESLRYCDPNEELDIVLRFFAFIAHEKNVEICLTRNPLSSWYGSPTKLRQLFSNLVSNALDSFDTIRDEREKKIKITFTEAEGNMTFQISDNGCGIPPHQKEKIFEAFFTTKPISKGTGIGLTTVQTIVTSHLHGKIDVESESDKGTEITISFPSDNTNLDAYHPHPHNEPHLLK